MNCCLFSFLISSTQIKKLAFEIKAEGGMGVNLLCDFVTRSTQYRTSKRGRPRVLSGLERLCGRPQLLQRDQVHQEASG